MKRCKLIAVSAIIACCVVGHANAAIVSIGTFNGVQSEGFEGLPFGFFASHPVFGNTGVVQTIDGSGSLNITSSWSFFGVVFARTGSHFMGSAGALPEWVFDTPAQRFGGYFTTNSGTDGAVAFFYDEANNLLGSMDVTAPANNSWVWNGWETTGVGIKRVVIDGNNPFGGGFIMHDDMEYTAIPAPGVLGLFAIGLGGMARRRRRTV